MKWQSSVSYGRMLRSSCVSSIFWSHWNRGLPALQFLKEKKKKNSWRTCARTLCTREQRTAMMMPLQNLERRHQRSFWNILKKTGPTLEVECGCNFSDRRCSIWKTGLPTGLSFHAKIKAFVKPSSSVPACVSELSKSDAGKHHEASHNSVLNAVRSRYIHGVDSQLIQQVQQIATPCQHNHIWDEGDLQDDNSDMHTT